MPAYNQQEMIEKAIIATRQLCKRQCTWLRDEDKALTLNQIEIEKAVKFLQERSA